MMTDPWTMDSFRSDLEKFIRRLEFFAVDVELETLKALQRRVHKQIEFKVSVSDLVFRIGKRIAKTRPPDVEKLEVLLSHKCTLDSAACKTKVDDHISDFTFDIHIRAFVGSTTYKYAWHLDPPIASSATKVTHPLYHFQGGGRDLGNIDTGSLVLLTAPRFPHPPMDLFLGVHFILSNFFSIKDYPEINRLFKDEDYIDVLRNAQLRMWDSYFTAYAPGKPQHQFYTRKSVFPLHVD